MPGQKKDQVKTVQNEAGGLSGRTGLGKGNPWPRHTPTVSRVPQAFTRLRHRVLIVPQIHYASITKEN